MTASATPPTPPVAPDDAAMDARIKRLVREALTEYDTDAQKAAEAAETTRLAQEGAAKPKSIWDSWGFLKG